MCGLVHSGSQPLISSFWSGGISVKFCTSKNFPLYGTSSYVNWFASSLSMSILTVTDLGGARFARVKEEAWQSFGRGVA